MLTIKDFHYTKLSSNKRKGGRKFEKLDKKLIATKEIAELMGINLPQLCIIRNSPFANMPAPVNDDRMYFIYMRESVLKWIKHWRFINTKSRSHLDNEMASAFLRSL